MLAAELSKKTTTKTVPRHLWNRDPKVAKIRLAFLIHWVRSSIVFWILMLLVALIYLGSGVNPIWHTQNLDVYITNFDDGLAGTYFIEAFQETPSGNQTLNWIFQGPTSQSELVQQIEDGKAWASVYMNAHTTDGINQVLQAILDGNPSDVSYVPSSATTIVYDQGRNFNTVNGYVLPPIRAAIAVASARYSAYLESQAALYSKATLSNVIASIDLSPITDSPIGSTDMNLHPSTPYASLLATTLGYLFLWLVTLGLVGASVRLTQPLAGKVKIIDIVIIRIFNSLFNGLIVSLIYSLCVLWFASFTRPVPFIRFWLFNWLAVITFSAIIALFVINLGTFAQAGLTLFLITNLSTSTTNLAIELQNGFYRVGYGLPLFHCFSGGRHFLFGSHTKLGVDIGVLFAFYFAALIFTLSTGIYRMWKQQEEILAEMRKSAQKKKTHNYYKIRNTTNKKT